MNHYFCLSNSRTSTISACRVISLAVLLALTAVNASAQSASSGTVSGQVTDPQGAALIGAEIRMTDPLTNTTRTTLTNDAGRFSFISVTPSVYDFVISKPGFSQSKI